ncbi:MAG TPA: DNA repair protein RecN [Firmicutes bacterium]|nr:DNA repair protein RecN [Candidatus Fermentithermobacillaceae bacterium]
MLSYLRIRNFGIFQDVELELRPGLSVFTGETGAGKSMIIDAVMACLGYRTSSDVIRTGEERATLDLLVIPGKDDGELREYLGDSAEISIQRDVLQERSYLRINGRIATMAMAQSLGSRLVDIHGQQEHHSLLRPQNYLRILDGMRRDLVEPAKSEFARLFEERQAILREMQDLRKDADTRKREIDLLSFQVEEIDRSRLKPGEEEVLRQEHLILSSQKRLMELTREAYRKLYSGEPGVPPVFELLGVAISLFKKVASTDPSAEKVCEALDQVMFSLESALDAIRAYEKKLTLDPRRLKEVEERLDLLERLKSKYGGNVEKILEYGAQAKKKLDTLIRADEILESLDRKLRDVEAQMVSTGQKLSDRRKEIASHMEKTVSKTLEDLGMPGARFIVRVEREPDPNGICAGGEKVRVFPDGFDRVSFLFSANPGEIPMPLHKVASGGELSRLMLAIKSYLEESDPVPVLIFDEIDAGVGGKAGQAIAEKLWDLSRTHQVLCVTHLASIAAMADNHYVVSKFEKDGRTFAKVELVEGERRVREISRMLSGTDMEISLEHGRELLLSAQKYKEAQKARSAPTKTQ